MQKIYLFIQKINIKKIFAIDRYIRFKNKIDKILIPNILDEKLKKIKKLFMDGIKPNYKPQKNKTKIIKKQKNSSCNFEEQTGINCRPFPYYINRYLIEDLKINWLLGPFAKIDKNLKAIKNLKILKNKKNLYID